MVLNWIIRISVIVSIIGIYLYSVNQKPELKINSNVQDYLNRLKKEFDAKKQLESNKQKIQEINESNLPQEEKEKEIQKIIKENSLQNGLNLEDLQQDEAEIMSEEQIERELDFLEKFGKEIQVGGIALEIYGVYDDIKDFADGLKKLKTTFKVGNTAKKSIKVADNVSGAIKTNSIKAIQKISQKISEKVAANISKAFSKSISKVASGIVKNSTKVASKALGAAKKIAGPALGAVFIGVGAFMCFSGVDNDDSLDEKRKNEARTACGIELAMDIVTLVAPLICAAIGGVVAGAVGAAIGPIAIALAVVMILTAIIDAADPCAYGRPVLDDKQLEDIITNILSSVYQEIVNTIKKEVPSAVREAYLSEIENAYLEAGAELNEKTKKLIMKSYNDMEEEINKKIDESIIESLNTFKYPAPYELQGSDFKTKLNDEDLTKFLKYYQEYFDKCNLQTPTWTEEQRMQFSINSEAESKLRAMRFDKLNQTFGIIASTDALNKQLMEETSMLAGQNLALVKNIIKTSNLAIENQKKINQMVNMSKKERERTLKFIENSANEVLMNSIENLTMASSQIPPDLYQELLTDLGVDESFVDEMKKFREENLNWRKEMTIMIKKNKARIAIFQTKIETKSSFDAWYPIGGILGFYFLYEIYNLLSYQPEIEYNYQYQQNFPNQFQN